MDWAKRGIEDALTSGASPHRPVPGRPVDVGIVIDLNLRCAAVSPYTGKLGLEHVLESVHLLLSHLSASKIPIGSLSATVVMTVGAAPSATVVLPAVSPHDAWNSVMNQVRDGMNIARDRFVRRVRTWRAAAREEIIPGSHTRTDLSDLVGAGLMARFSPTPGQNPLHLIIVSEDGAGSNEVAAELLVGSLFVKSVRISGLLGAGAGSLNSLREHDALNFIARVTQGVIANTTTVQDIVLAICKPPSPKSAVPAHLPWPSLLAECRLQSTQENQEVVFDNAQEVYIDKASAANQYSIGGGHQYPFRGAPTDILVRRGVVRKFQIVTSAVRLVLACLGRDGFQVDEVDVKDETRKPDLENQKKQVRITLDVVRLWRNHIRIVERLKFRALESNLWDTPDEVAQIEIAVIGEPSVFHFLLRAENNSFGGLTEQTRVKMKSLLQKITEVENVNRFVSNLAAPNIQKSAADLSLAFVSSQLQPSRWHRIFQITACDVVLDYAGDSNSFRSQCLDYLSPFKIPLLGTTFAVIWSTTGFTLVEFKLVAARVGRFVQSSFATTFKERNEVEMRIKLFVGSSSPSGTLIPPTIPADLYSLPHAELPRMTLSSSPQPSLSLSLGYSLFASARVAREGLPSRIVLHAMQASRRLSGFLQLDDIDLADDKTHDPVECRYLKVCGAGALFYSLRLEDTYIVATESRLHPPGSAELEQYRILVEEEDAIIASFAGLMFDLPKRTEYPICGEWLLDDAWPTTKVRLKHFSSPDLSPLLAKETRRNLVDNLAVSLIEGSEAWVVSFDEKKYVFSISWENRYIIVECRLLSMPSAWQNRKWPSGLGPQQDIPGNIRGSPGSIPSAFREHIGRAFGISRMEFVWEALSRGDAVDAEELDWLLANVCIPLTISLGRVAPSSSISESTSRKILVLLQSSSWVHECNVTYPSRYFFTVKGEKEGESSEILEYSVLINPFMFTRHCIGLPASATGRYWIERLVQAATAIVEDACTLSAGRKVLSLVSSELDLPRIVLDAVSCKAKTLSLEVISETNQTGLCLMKSFRCSNDDQSPELAIEQFSELNGNFSMVIKGDALAEIREKTLDSESKYPILTIFRLADSIAYDSQLQALLDHLDSKTEEFRATAQLVTLAERYPNDAPLQARGVLVANDVSGWKRLFRRRAHLQGEADRSRVFVNDIIQGLLQGVKSSPMSHRITDIDNSGFPSTCLLYGPLKVHGLRLVFFAAAIHWAGAHWKSMGARVVVGGFLRDDMAKPGVSIDTREMRRDLSARAVGRVLDLFESALGSVLDAGPRQLGPRTIKFNE